MKIVLGWSILVITLIQAQPVVRQIDDIIRYQEQKKIFETQNKERQTTSPIYTEIQSIPLSQENNVSSACIQLDKIDTDAITLIEKKELSRVIHPYIHHCDTMQSINTMVKKINNIYIKKAYVTSRAYIKPQDISKGILIISAMEGKIEDVKGKDISTALVFPFIKHKYLNLRDLEVGIEQLNRLQSIKAIMSINPGKKEGYSQILMRGEKVGSVIHGNFGINNYGTSKSGRYQLNGSLGWDNPLGINDLLTINLNTTNKQDKKNSSIGNSISYALPIGKSYLELSYSKFKYNQIVNGLNVDYESRGESENFQVKLEYKLFHTKTQRGKFDFSLLRKKNNNYLAGVFLDTSSNKLSVLQLGYTHSYTGVNWDGYMTVQYHRGLKWFGAKSGSEAKPTFHKYTLDISYNKRFKGAGVPVHYNFSFHGQYAKQGIIGSEQIGIGGPYSVRGFRNEGQLSGNKGFYIRNELSLNKTLKQGSFNPYFALDWGVVGKNRQSYGGHIVGAAVGVRANYHNFSLDVFKSMPIVDSNKITFKTNGDEIRKTYDGFVGFAISYRF